MPSQVPNKIILELLTLSLMKKGGKHVAEFLVVRLINILRKKYKVSPSVVLLEAVDNVKPLIGFRNVKLRGSSYKIPFFLKKEQQITTAIDWILSSARRSNMDLSQSLAKELIQASLKQGDPIKKRNETHKLGNQNKVFAHYRWF
jgi:small subunit ribosomal protein S7